MDISNQDVTATPVLAVVRPPVIIGGAGLLLALLLGLLSPSLALWVLLTAAAIVLAIARPWLLLCLVPPAVALDTVVALDIGPLHAGPTDALLGAVVVGWCWRALRPDAPGASAQRLRLARPPWWVDPAARAVGLALCAYLAAVVLSVAVAHDHTAALKEVLKWTEVLVLFTFAAGALTRPERRLAAAWVIIATGVAEALLGYAQWAVAAGELGVGGASVRVYGTFGQPNPYAAYLNLCLPLAIALAVLGRQTPQRWLAAGAAVLLLGAQVLAASRGAELGLAAALLVMLVLALGIVRPALVVGVAAGALGGAAWVVGLVPTALRGRLLDTLRIENVSITGPVNDANFSSVERLAHWVAGLRMFAAHPLLGVGAGNYATAYPLYKVPSWNQALGHAHDYYINAAAETGLLGLLALLAVVAAVLWLVGRAAAHDRSPTPRATVRDWRDWLGGALGRAASASWLAVGVGGVVAAVLVHSVVDDLFVHGMELQFALLLALCAALLIARRAPVPAGSTAD